MVLTQQQQQGKQEEEHNTLTVRVYEFQEEEAPIDREPKSKAKRKPVPNTILRFDDEDIEIRGRNYRFSGLEGNTNYFGTWVIHKLKVTGLPFAMIWRHMHVERGWLLRQLHKDVQIHSKRLTFENLYKMAEVLGVTYLEVLEHFFIEDPGFTQKDIVALGFIVEKYSKLSSEYRNALLITAHAMPDAEQSDNKGM